MVRNRLLISALALSLVQIGFLSWIIVGRAAILRDGREVLLKVQPVDPRDLLRGDYVRLGYDISSIPVTRVTNFPVGATSIAEGPIFVRVKKQPDGFWSVLSANLGEPAPAPIAGDEIDLRGVAAADWTIGEIDTVDVDYGIERFYLPEGEGVAIQNDMSVRPFSMRVAVASDGTAQVKALMDGERTLFQEPLY
jgi:uncharacterized membrane-anchored protein